MTDDLKAQLEMRVYDISDKQISFGSSCGVGRCRPDIVYVEPDGKYGIIEVKMGNADLTIRQSEIFPQIKDGNAIPRSRAMKIRDVTEILKSIGWSVRKDEVGDRCALFELPDRKVDIIYGLDRIRDQQKLGSMLSVSTDEFSDACGTIYGSKVGFCSLITAWNGLDIRAPEILAEHVRQASDEAIAWAQGQDLEKALRDHAARPTDSPGTGPVLHLAASALLGDVTKLKSYQASFEAGDRLGFVPYIVRDHIDRAVALAEELAAKSS